MSAARKYYAGGSGWYGPGWYWDVPYLGVHAEFQAMACTYSRFGVGILLALDEYDTHSVLWEATDSEVMDSDIIQDVGDTVQGATWPR